MKNAPAERPKFNVYDTPAGALAATDQFYWLQEGFEYPEDIVTEWVTKNVKTPKAGRSLDLAENRMLRHRHLRRRHRQGPFAARDR
jgi:hypothetical protein